MIVAISRQYGAGAIDIARIVADRCGLRLISEELPELIADRLGLSADELLNDEDSVPSFFERCLALLPGATSDGAAMPNFDEIDFYDAMRRQVEHTLREGSGSLDAVILGRAVSQVLGVRWNVIRVYLHAPHRWRVLRVMEAFGCDEHGAQKMIKHADRARERYVKQFYGGVWGDARAYDLTIDTSRMSIAESAELIISAVAARYHQA